LANGNPPVINLGNADVLREYIYIDDLAEAYMFLGENLAAHNAEPMPRTGRSTYGWSAYNVGSYSAAQGKTIEEFSNIRSVRQVIDLLRKEMGSTLEPQTIPKAENFIEIPDQFLDSQKLHDFGFVPKIDFEEGIRRSVEWYTKNQDLLTRLGARWT
jgi:CDP-glucose 4,6-dehydratase